MLIILILDILFVHTGTQDVPSWTKEDPPRVWQSVQPGTTNVHQTYILGCLNAPVFCSSESRSQRECEAAPNSFELDFFVSVADRALIPSAKRQSKQGTVFIFVH